MAPKAAQKTPLKTSIVKRPHAASKVQVVKLPPNVKKMAPFRAAINGPGPEAIRQLDAVSKNVCAERPTIVLVFRESCYFCSQLKPSWNTFAEQLMPTRVGIVEIDSDALQAPPTGSNAMVDKIRNGFSGGVPHIVMLTPENPSGQLYDGDRSSLNLMEFVRSNMARA